MTQVRHRARVPYLPRADAAALARAARGARRLGPAVAHPPRRTHQRVRPLPGHISVISIDMVTPL